MNNFRGFIGGEDLDKDFTAHTSHANRRNFVRGRMDMQLVESVQLRRSVDAGNRYDTAFDRRRDQQDCVSQT